MRRFVHASLLAVFPAVLAAQPGEFREPDGGGVMQFENVQCLSDEFRHEILLYNKSVIDTFHGQGILLKISDDDPIVFGFPLAWNEHIDGYGFHGISGFVDHDPAYPNQLRDYTGGTRTYDLASGYNHKGTDYFLWPFNWNMVHNDEVIVIASADGVILNKVDGNFDQNCGFIPGQTWNAVYIGHDDGSQAWYGHMKNGTTTPKATGERVERGEYLGVVASSGQSTGPHLHFEIYDASLNLIDPYQGPHNPTVNRSWWEDQRPYYDSAINRLQTHAKPPEFRSCPALHDVNESNQFDSGDTLFLAVYYRDQLQGQESDLRIYRPDGSVWQSWSNSSTDPHYAAAFWYWWVVVPHALQNGEYTFEVSYEGKSYTHGFSIGAATGISDRKEIPRLFALRQNFPNPFNPSTTIEYSIESGTHVAIKVYDLLGRELAVLVNEFRESGFHSVEFSPGDLPSGVYYYRMSAGGFDDVKKFVVAK